MKKNITLYKKNNEYIIECANSPYNIIQHVNDELYLIKNIKVDDSLTTYIITAQNLIKFGRIETLYYITKNIGNKTPFFTYVNFNKLSNSKQLIVTDYFKEKLNKTEFKAIFKDIGTKHIYDPDTFVPEVVRNYYINYPDDFFKIINKEINNALKELINKTAKLKPKNTIEENFNLRIVNNQHIIEPSTIYSPYNIINRNGQFFLIINIKIVKNSKTKKEYVVFYVHNIILGIKSILSYTIDNIEKFFTDCCYVNFNFFTNLDQKNIIDFFKRNMLNKSFENYFQLEVENNNYSVKYPTNYLINKKDELRECIKKLINTATKPKLDNQEKFSTIENKKTKFPLPIKYFGDIKQYVDHYHNNKISCHDSNSPNTITSKENGMLTTNADSLKNIFTTSTTDNKITITKGTGNTFIANIDNDDLIIYKYPRKRKRNKSSVILEEDTLLVINKK